MNIINLQKQMSNFGQIVTLLSGRCLKSLEFSQGQENGRSQRRMWGCVKCLQWVKRRETT